MTRILLWLGHQSETDWNPSFYIIERVDWEDVSSINQVFFDCDLRRDPSHQNAAQLAAGILSIKDILMSSIFCKSLSYYLLIRSSSLKNTDIHPEFGLARSLRESIWQKSLQLYRHSPNSSYLSTEVCSSCKHFLSSFKDPHNFVTRTVPLWVMCVFAWLRYHVMRQANMQMILTHSSH